MILIKNSFIDMGNWQFNNSAIIGITIIVLAFILSYIVVPQNYFTSVTNGILWLLCPILGLLGLYLILKNHKDVT